MQFMELLRFGVMEGRLNSSGVAKGIKRKKKKEEVNMEMERRGNLGDCILVIVVGFTL